MKYLTVLAVVLLFAALFGSGLARSPQVCGYTNSEGKLIFLQHFPQNNQVYTDIDENGNCVKKVECMSDYTLREEEC